MDEPSPAPNSLLVIADLTAQGADTQRAICAAAQAILRDLLEVSIVPRDIKEVLSLLLADGAPPLTFELLLSTCWWLGVDAGDLLGAIAEKSA